MKFYPDLMIDKRMILVPDSGVVWSYSDVLSKDSGKDESGVQHNIVLREDVRSCTLEYRYISRKEYLYMRSLWKGKQQVEITYREHDGTVGRFIAAKPSHKITVDNAPLGYYRSLKIVITEL